MNQKSARRFDLKPLAWAAIGGLAAVVTTAGALELPFLHKDKAAAAATRTAAAAPVAALPQLPPGTAPNYRAIVEASGPAVVGITVEGRRQAGADDDETAAQAAPNDPFYRFFRGIPGYGGQPPGSQPFRGQGSGFIVASDGLVLTNAHVVRDAKEVTVRLADRREFAAKVLGLDTATDIAVLRIEAQGLPTVRIGEPKHLQVGDYVLAIGAPFGLEQSATSGIVSAKGRSLPGDAYVPFIQTDAAVNPGNSGGPLFDAAGNVVGINSQIYSRSGGYQGLSFAIPIDVALKVRDQIVATGKMEHARLGVAIQDVNQKLAESFGLPRPEGALVAQVTPKSAAAAAGLKAGDVVLAVDGERIVQSGQLSSRIGLSRPGDTVKLSVWRDKAERELSVKLGSASEKAVVAEAGREAAPAAGQLGLALRELTRNERAQAQLDHGLVVEGARGAAAKAGIEAGDVVLAINGRPVDNVGDLRAVLDGKPRSVALLVMRNGENLFVPVPLG